MLIFSVLFPPFSSVVNAKIHNTQTSFTGSALVISYVFRWLEIPQLRQLVARVYTGLVPHPRATTVQLHPRGRASSPGFHHGLGRFSSCRLQNHSAAVRKPIQARTHVMSEIITKHGACNNVVLLFLELNLN